MSPPLKSVTGEYDRNGYAVTLNGPEGARRVYSAGNHPKDSQASASPGLSLHMLRGFCIRTCREIAAERGISYGGVTRVKEETA
jgi:hypothetical protein